MDYPRAKKFLDGLVNYEQFPKAVYDFDLDGFQEFLKTIGSPEKKLKSVILVAGTKGKGSTCALLESALRTAGYKTGLYSSPHLVSIRERISISGRDIGKKTFARLVATVAPAVKNFPGRPITYFEVLTAVAFLAFVEAETDYTVLEVGLGGRLDATNVTKPVVSVITRIGLDHTEILGDTLEKIAREKAGIIRDLVPVIAAPQEPSVADVLRKKCHDTVSRLIFVDDEAAAEWVRLDPTGTLFLARGPWGKRWAFIPLLGRHQITNALTALVTLYHLKITEKEPDTLWHLFGKGLGLTRLRARAELIKKEPPVLLDTCHNPDSAAALRATVKEVFNGMPVTLVLGLSSDKPIEPIIKALLPFARRTFMTQARSVRAQPVEILVQAARNAGFKADPIIPVKAALKKALSGLKKNELLIVTGSFYIARDTLDFFKQ